MTGRSTTKLFVGNIKEDCRSSELRLLFEKYGEVAECDVVKDFAFVHFYKVDDAMAALEGLDGSEFQGIVLRVQLSHSKVRQKPGMSEKEGCFRCGKDGHWAKDCRAPPRRDEASYRSDHGGYGDDYYRGPTARDYYPPAPSGGPPPDRYHPYDRRPAPPPPAPGPGGPGYSHVDYAWPADYYMKRPESHGYFSNADNAHHQPRDPPETDELGRPPPEYYAHRLKDALFELVKDPKRIPPHLRDQIGRTPASYSSSGSY